jgi:hypothetical protein
MTTIVRVFHCFRYGFKMAERLATEIGMSTQNSALNHGLGQGPRTENRAEFYAVSIGTNPV